MESGERRGRNPRPRWLALAVVLLAATGGLTLIETTRLERCPPMAPTPGTFPRANPPALILLQRRTTDEHTSRTPYVVAHAEEIERLPFEGMVINIPASWEAMRGRPLDDSDVYRSWLAPIDGRFQRFRNFVEIKIDDPGDLFDDRAWDVTVENFRIIARAARAAGFVGIFFDNEEYEGRWLTFPDDYPGTTRSLDDYRDQARRRGREVMAAIVAEFPRVVFLVYHGPYLSEPKTPAWVTAGQGEPDTGDLGGPLFVGFLEGLGPEATLIDGGEVYAYRTAEDFARSYQWRKFDLPSAATDSAFIPEEVRPAWSERVSLSYGLYNLPYPEGATMDPPTMRGALEQALRHADEYVWYYAWGDNWLIPGDVSSCWFSAVEGARAAVGLEADPGAPPGASDERLSTLDS